MADFLIIIPAYNEASNIGCVLKELIARSLPADILVINDGSADDTGAIARTFPVHVISHPTNLGYGAALQTGYKYAAFKGYEYVLQFDSDGQHNPDDLWRIIEALRLGDADVVIGSRFLGDPDFHPGSMKMMAIAWFRFLIRWFGKSNVTDPTSGLRGAVRKVFAYYSVSDRFPADYPDADIVIQMLLYDFQIQEVPIHSKERMSGASMHAGVKPIIYMLKIMISIAGILFNHRIVKWGKHHG